MATLVGPSNWYSLRKVLISFWKDFNTCFVIWNECHNIQWAPIHIRKTLIPCNTMSDIKQSVGAIACPGAVCDCWNTRELSVEVVHAVHLIVSPFLTHIRRNPRHHSFVILECHVSRKYHLITHSSWVLPFIYIIMKLIYWFRNSCFKHWKTHGWIYVTVHMQNG